MRRREETDGEKEGEGYTEGYEEESWEYDRDEGNKGNKESRKENEVVVWSRNSPLLPVWMTFFFETQIINLLLC